MTLNCGYCLIKMWKLKRQTNPIEEWMVYVQKSHPHIKTSTSSVSQSSKTKSRKPFLSNRTVSVFSISMSAADYSRFLLTLVSCGSGFDQAIGKRAREWLLQSTLNPERFAASFSATCLLQGVRKATSLLYLHRRDPLAPPQILFPLRAATGTTSRGMDTEDERGGVALSPFSFRNVILNHCWPLLTPTKPPSSPSSTH